MSFIHLSSDGLVYEKHARFCEAVCLLMEIAIMLFRKNGLTIQRPRRPSLKTIILSFIMIGGTFGIDSSGFGKSPSLLTDKLMAADALPDIPLGKKEAPITIIEYAAVTCPHCGAFHATSYPLLKSKYIDTGKVYFVLREFLLNPLDLAGFMLARCSGEDKRNAMIDLLFDQQKNWAFVEKPLEALSNLVKQTGMSTESFELCLKDQDLNDKIRKVGDRASTELGVNSTPTFFINGKKHAGAIPPDELDKLLSHLTKD